MTEKYDWIYAKGDWKKIIYFHMTSSQLMYIWIIISHLCWDNINASYQHKPSILFQTEIMFLNIIPYFSSSSPFHQSQDIRSHNRKGNRIHTI